MPSPFEKEQVNAGDVLAALREIEQDMNTTRMHAQRFIDSQRTDAEMAMVLALSGLEIKMTNFTQEIRRKMMM